MDLWSELPPGPVAPHAAYGLVGVPEGSRKEYETKPALLGCVVEPYNRKLDQPEAGS